ncbi:Anthranilate phosphoribosyltransferase [Ceratocystis fimbriata CBS 114723]|uniref:Anthranilate phosphoribosyltransferase n=1 Tax=Ceratocystis fimbriata CBS 114723 TaxID=1035309 RepID=A0A2C5WZ55_9PEZI|nr:Anthranilate phosphoribosyltransferase [Ceratocystis fimbriata CBS 114723]
MASSQAQIAGSSASATVVKTDIKPLLQSLWPGTSSVTPTEIADAISLFFTNQVSESQAASLLICLHFTQLDIRADVLAECARVMRNAAEQVDAPGLQALIQKKGLSVGKYNGGLCDIVGTGGDSHNTFNISTTASIIASGLLLVSKHGNRASTSKSGSADLVNSMAPRPPILNAVTPTGLIDIYTRTNYAFLFAPVFHPGMRYVAPVRKQLPWRTIFNNLGPLANPVEAVLEARVIGVARRALGPAFAEALRLAGVRKALIICGAEELDEISCAGPTYCWMLQENAQGEVHVREFTVSPEDFGFERHALSEVESGKEPKENAELLHRILNNELEDNNPLLQFILMNAAALFVVSGMTEADESDMGEGDDRKVVTERGPGDCRWKEGVRRARWCVKSGAAWKQWSEFVNVTNDLGE